MNGKIYLTKCRTKKNSIRGELIVKNIGIYDTEVMTMNMGDYIIMDSINRELLNLFSDSFFVKYPSRKEMSLKDLRWLRHQDYFFVGGTNLLNSKMNKSKRWRVSKKEIFFINDIILMGVGWHSYEGKANKATKKLLRSLSKNNFIHSVRDEYTLNKVKDCGINNVLNTGCPTTWKLTHDHCSQIPTKKANKVITTITDYNKDIKSDELMINTLKKLYNEVYFWIQGTADYDYFKSLNIDHHSIKIIPPQLSAYDKVLRENDIDFVGTRLHAGIRAMQFKKRSLIIGIDNRATEIHKDININILNRSEISNMDNIVSQELVTNIILNTSDIEMWKKQFVGA